MWGRWNYCWISSEYNSSEVITQHASYCVQGVCNFLSSFSPQQKLEVTDGPVFQLCVTAQFYLESKGKYIFEAWGQANPKDAKRSPGLNFGSSFYMFFLLPLNLPYVNWANQEGCLFYLRSSLQSSDFLCSIFSGFSLLYLWATTILDSFFLF